MQPARLLQRPLVQRVAMQTRERERPVEALGHTRNLLERLLAQELHEARDLFGKPRVDAGEARVQDRNLLLRRPDSRAMCRGSAGATRRRGRADRFDVRITAGRARARIVPSSGIVT